MWAFKSKIREIIVQSFYCAIVIVHGKSLDIVNRFSDIVIDVDGVYMGDRLLWVKL